MLSVSGAKCTRKAAKVAQAHSRSAPPMLKRLKRSRKSETNSLRAHSHETKINQHPPECSKWSPKSDYLGPKARQTSRLIPLTVQTSRRSWPAEKWRQNGQKWIVLPQGGPFSTLEGTRRGGRGPLSSDRLWRSANSAWKAAAAALDLVQEMGKEQNYSHAIYMERGPA